MLEEQVYESVFHYITNSSVKKVYIANATDRYWFERNSIKDVQKYLQKSELAKMPDGLLESLYEKNSIPHVITWKPIMITSEFLPKEYALNKGKVGKGYNCLVNMNEGNIGIRINNHSYRSYFTISKAAITDDKKHALIKIGRHSAPMRGAGEWLLELEKIGLEWKVAGGLNFWIS